MSDKKEDIEIGEDVVEAVADKVEASLSAKLDEIKMPSADDIATKMVELTEKTVKKNVSEDKDIKVTAVDLPKEVRFTRGLLAFKNGDAKGIAEYNSYVDKAWRAVNKSDYQNVTTTADGGALVPDPEFIAEIDRLTDEYGVAARLCNVRKTDRDSVTLLRGTNEVSFTATTEAAEVSAQKMTYGNATASLVKYIATLVMTSEILEDSAINMWQDATNEIARARAKLFDELVFTDSTYGLLSAAVGDTYKCQAVGSAITDFSADDAMDARYKVVGSARKNGRYFMHPTIWNYLRQTKEATTGGYLFGGVGQSVTPTIDGIPVELVDIMPEYSEVPANTAFAVFGDLSRIMIHVKRLLETKIFDAGVVRDAGGSNINLITQDSWAMRATMRVVPQTRFEGAFAILGTGNVS